MTLHRRLFAMLMIFMLPVTVNAMPVTYDFTLAISGGYTINGMFTGEDLNNDNFIRDTEVTTLSYELLQGAAVIDAATGLSAALNSSSSWNFNYGLTAGMFASGGSIQSSSGQSWCWEFCASNTIRGVAFHNATVYVAGRMNGQLVGQTSVVSGGNQVPAPPPVALLGAGLLALGCVRRRKHKKSALHT